MEGLVGAGFWRGKKVLITGQTGFKGGWLSAWLYLLGARVVGYALPPPTNPSFHDAMNLGSLIKSRIGDIRDLEGLSATFRESEPEIVFHLAAQPLVLASYADPLETYGTNVMGTAHVLDCARKTKTVRAIVVVTTDKCYENRGWVWGYREDDRLGGDDPYSNSKACTELVSHSYRYAFFKDQAGPRLATVRAGNVIGGGDFGLYRIVPDLVRAAFAGEPIKLRYPEAVRPWQFVLDPLRGYIEVAQRLSNSDAGSASAWNFGPELDAAGTVSRIVEEFQDRWGNPIEVLTESGPKQPEAEVLRLDSSKARLKLGWRPRLEFSEMMEWTVEWYRTFKDNPHSVRETTFGQIDRFMALEG